MRRVDGTNHIKCPHNLRILEESVSRTQVNKRMLVSTVFIWTALFIVTSSLRHVSLHIHTSLSPLH